MKQQFAIIQHNLDAKLLQMGEEQHVVHLDVDKLHMKHERLAEENANLRQTIQQLASTVEELDMDKRKRNLLFFGIPRREGVSCEQLIREMLRNDLGIAEAVYIEQARRVANAFLVTFQSLKQKVLILTKARLLTSENALSIRRDFPEAVRRRRGGLVEYYRQLLKTIRRPSSAPTSCSPTTECSPTTYSNR